MVDQEPQYSDIPSHTEEHTVGGPPFCAECSASVQEYVSWPCSAEKLHEAWLATVRLHESYEIHDHHGAVVEFSDIEITGTSGGVQLHQGISYELVLRVINNAPDPAAALKAFVDQEREHAADDAVRKFTNGSELPLHRTEANSPLVKCATCDGGGCPDCTDPA